MSSLLDAGLLEALASLLLAALLLELSVLLALLLLMSPAFERSVGARKSSSFSGVRHIGHPMLCKAGGVISRRKSDDGSRTLCRTLASRSSCRTCAWHPNLSAQQQVGERADRQGV